MLDQAALRSQAWRSWHVFAYAFVVYLLTLVAMVRHGSLLGLRTDLVFAAALMAAVAVAGIGYQEVRDAGGFQRPSRRGLADDER